MIKTDYDILAEQLRALVEGVPHRTANLANASALIFSLVEDLNWAGFYFLEGDTLVLGPFQGKPACIEIPAGKGVCGAAVAAGCSQLVSNVHDFAGHIACDSASNSELVVPLYGRDGRIAGVLDLDSPTVGRFCEEDLEGFERIAEILSELVL